MHVRSVGDVVDGIDIVTVVGGSNGDALALADTAGVGAVELLAVPRQRVDRCLTPDGWKNHHTFRSVDIARRKIIWPNVGHRRLG